jgi:hypothetical protein
MEQSLNSDFSLSYSLDRPLFESSMRFKMRSVRDVDQDEEVVNFDYEDIIEENCKKS